MKKNEIVRNTLPVMLIYRVLFFLVLAGCAMPLGEDYSLGTKTVESTSYITDYNLQAYVPIPTVGAVPVKNMSTRREMEITVKWLDANSGADITGSLSEFEEGAGYKAEITLKARAGWAFDPVVSFGYPEGTVAGQPPANTATDIRILTVSYKPTGVLQSIEKYVVDYDLQHYVPVPVAGAIPVTRVTRPDMDVTVDWKDGNGAQAVFSSGVFEEGRTYQADIALTAVNGYSFFSGANFKYPVGSVDGQPGDNPAPDVRALSTVIYKPTAAPQTITGENLAPRIDGPVTWGSPVKSFAGPTYSGTVEWRVLPADLVMPAGLFQPGTEYKAVVSLYPAPGHVFSSGQSGGFTYSGNGVSSITTHGRPVNGTMTGIEIFFPATGNSPVNDLDVTLKVLQPVNGGVPDTTVSGPQYSAGTTVSWKEYDGAAWAGMGSSAFQQGVVYRVEFTLTAATGYTFAGIGATSQSVLPVFTHAVGTVTHLEGTGNTLDISVAFPATEAPPPGFGPVGLAGSALYQMAAKATEDALTITLPAGTEDLAAGLEISWNATAKNTPRSVIIDGGGRVLRATGDGKPLITLVGDSSLNAGAANLTFFLKNITIKGKGGFNAPLVKVTGKAKLVLGAGAVLENNENNTTTPANYGGAVHVADGSFLEMRTGSAVRDNRATGNANPTGGVYVGTGGKFTMTGGVMSGNEAASKESGGGVYAYGTGAVVMSGGDITENTSAGLFGGGGLSFLGGTFTMTGGRISGNTTTGTDAGGGVSMIKNTTNRGNFTMSGGEISGNTALKGNSSGGVMVYSADFTMNDGVISGNHVAAVGKSGSSAGGVYVYAGKFTMNNGSVTGNTAAVDSSSGGVLITGDSINLPEFNLNGGRISSNTATGAATFSAPSAGGVLIQYGTITMTRGEISANTAASGYSGGGVGIYGNYCALAMTGGIIFGNKIGTAANSAGGVYMGAAKFTMSGSAEISGHSVSGDSSGGGVYLFSGAFTMTGGLIRANTATGASSGGGVRTNATTMTVQGGAISANTATGDASGGGVYQAGGLVNLEGGLVSDNRSVYANSAGGVYMASGNLYLKTGGEISGNTAEGSNSAGGFCAWGGMQYLDGGKITGNRAAAANSGGGVYYPRTDKVDAFKMSAGEISGNQALAANSAGGVYIPATTSVSGVDKPMQGTFAFKGGDIKNNTAAGTSSAGGVWMAGGYFTLSGGRITDNRAEKNSSAGGMYFARANITTDAVTMSTGEISGNQALGKDSAGGVIIPYGTTAVFAFSGGDIKNNTVGGTDSAGGVRMAGGIFKLTGGRITGNRATNTHSAGGMYYTKFGTGDDVTMSTGEISGNRAEATNSAGGVYIRDGGTAGFAFSGGKIENNIAAGTYSGGGVRVSGGKFKITGGKITGNQATKDYSAGGIYYTKTTTTTNDVTMSLGEISGNRAEAANSAGGVNMGAGNTAGFDFSGGKIETNTAAETSSGGGLQVSGGTFTMTNGYIRYNVAVKDTNTKGGVRTAGGTFTLTSGNVTGNTAKGIASDGP